MLQVTCNKKSAREWDAAVSGVGVNVTQDTLQHVCHGDDELVHLREGRGPDNKITGCLEKFHHEVEVQLHDAVSRWCNWVGADQNDQR